MKILFATEYYHPFVPGGTPWSLRLLARELQRRGEDVAIVTPNYGAPAREAVDGVPVFRFPFWRRLRPGSSTAPTRDHANPLFHLLVARAVLGAARRLGSEVIHAQEKHVLVGSYAAARWLRRPIFLTLRDYGLLCPIATCLLTHDAVPADCSTRKLQRECAPEFFQRYLDGARGRRMRLRAVLALLYWDARLKGRLVRGVDGLISVSQSTLEIYARAGRAAPARSRVVYNIAPPASAPTTPGEQARVRERYHLPDGPLVLYVGKLSPGKGIDVFLEAAARLRHRPSPACFVVAGAGSAALPAPGVDVRFLGALPHEQVLDLYAVADVVAQPAVWPEPFSRVPLEAAAHARPVVASAIGGNAEAVVDGLTGLLVPRGEAPALAGALARLLDDQALRQGLGEKAQALVGERFGPGAAAGSLLAAYRAALG